MVDNNSRILAAAEYLKFREEILKDQIHWKELFKKWEQKEITFNQSLALIHPDIIFLNTTNDDEIDFIVEDLQIKQSFPKNYADVFCQSEKVWGYKCVFIDKRMNKDHFFPKSLGGPTISKNKLVLCESHNLMKTDDCHNWKWEQKPNWVAEQIKKINNVI